MRAKNENGKVLHQDSTKNTSCIFSNIDNFNNECTSPVIAVECQPPQATEMTFIPSNMSTRVGLVALSTVNSP